jgi:hypothetical protein
MRKKGIDREVVVLLISTLITIASWVGFEVYRAYVKVKLPADVEKYLEPINPTLKKNVFTELEKLNP